MSSAAFSAIMTVGAWVLPRMIVGITEASATRSPSTPTTLRSLPTTLPIAQVPTGWPALISEARSQASISPSLCT